MACWQVSHQRCSNLTNSLIEKNCHFFSEIFFFLLLCTGILCISSSKQILKAAQILSIRLWRAKSRNGKEGHLAIYPNIAVEQTYAWIVLSGIWNTFFESLVVSISKQLASLVNNYLPSLSVKCLLKCMHFKWFALYLKQVKLEKTSHIVSK